MEVVASYEWWQPAINTHLANFKTPVVAGDIRALDLGTLPKDIDYVVGSPPCTQFSLSNRGGSGDIEDGLKDVRKFLEVVRYLRPRGWAMENVPQLEPALRTALKPGGVLEEFADLVTTMLVCDASDFGVPQKRRRLIVGSLDLPVLDDMRRQPATLGDVLQAVAQEGLALDPVFPGWTGRVTDNVVEEPLTAQELRLNRDAKTYHRVYNNMSFPERLDAPSRTITATCTRVSRESLVIEDVKTPGQFRRLTVRERALCQSFPLTFQFHSSSFSDRAKMVGNAIPPLLAYAVVAAISGEHRSLEADTESYIHVAEASEDVVPDPPGRSFRARRSFAAAIPGLRFKSGMRFQLANEFDGDIPVYRTSFHFGNSKNPYVLVPGQFTLDWLTERVPLMSEMRTEVEDVLRLRVPSSSELQRGWTGRAACDPFHTVDLLGELAEAVVSRLGGSPVSELEVDSFVIEVAKSRGSGPQPGRRKLRDHGPALIAGLYVCSLFNLAQVDVDLSGLEREGVLVPTAVMN
jgi:DNA (cytosine-5)-methyltransferase 1